MSSPAADATADWPSDPTELPDYYGLLARLHRHLGPATYVEIGVAGGISLGCALPETRVVGIDPSPEPSALEAHPRAVVFAAASDDVFAHHDLSTVLGGAVDLAFVDGMHLFEFALRDLAHLQPHLSDDAVVLVHDCLPPDAACAARERSTVAWAGDVWKAVLCLVESVTGAEVHCLDVPPTGLAMVRGLAGAEPMAPHLDRWQEAYRELPFERRGDLAAEPWDWPHVEALLADPSRPAAP